LITNALKYTNPDKAPRIQVKADIQPDTVILSVRDDGIGIESRDQERIFSVFERLHTQAAYPGSGVGLAIVRRAVERMNGRVSVESAPQKGSCFLVALRRAG
jgi:signal transduction histidine kinase